MDTKSIGDVTELEVLTFITKLGYMVSKPFGDRGRYDQIWDINGKLLKIQIKTASAIDDEPSGFKFSCRSSQRRNGKCKNTRYTSEEIDYFATMFNSKCYLVPIAETSTEKVLRLRTPKNNQLTNVSFAEDYEVEKVLSNLN